LPNIDSALTLTRFAGRDNTDGFFFAIFILHATHVDDQKHGTFDGSNGVPPLLAGFDAILAEHCVGIIENKCRGLERDTAVFQLVDPVLFAVPLEPLRYTKRITFASGSQMAERDNQGLNRLVHSYRNDNIGSAFAARRAGM
jgi:hypothetical protein